MSKRLGIVNSADLENWNAEPSPFDKETWDVCNQVRVICTVNNACGLLPTKKQKEIAQLIASAPDLLAAGKELLENEPFGVTPYFDEALRKIETAIVKAES